MGLRARALGGVVGSHEQARILLRAGACGPALRAGGVDLYDETRVHEVGERPFVDEAALVAACHHGLYVARLARDLQVDVSLTWGQLAAQVRRYPVMPPLTAGLLGARVRLSGRLPWVATLCGLVVPGADVTGFDPLADGSVDFRLERPGAWFAARGAPMVPDRSGWASLADLGAAAPGLSAQVRRAQRSVRLPRGE